MQHQHRQHQQTPPPSSPSSPSKRSILDLPDQHLSPRQDHYRGPSSPLAYVAPIDTFFTSPRQPADQAAYAYQHHRSQRSSIDSTVPSPQDLAREYLHSPGSEHSSPISDPSPIITTPSSTKSPLHQASSAIPNDVVHHEHSHDDQTGDRHELDSSESGRYPAQGDLKGLGIYPYPTGPITRSSVNSIAISSKQDQTSVASPTSPSTRGPPTTAAHSNRSVAFHIHFPTTTSPANSDRFGTKVSQTTPASSRHVEEVQEVSMATLETPEGKSTPRPMSASASARRASPPPLVADGSYNNMYANSESKYGLAPPGQQQGDGMQRSLQLRASADPFVGGTGYTGMTPTPSRHTFESVGVQMPEIQNQAEQQVEQQQSLPALKTVVQDESAFGPLPPAMDPGSAPAQMYEGQNGTPIGEGFPPSRPYRRSFTSYSAGAATHSSRKSSMSFNDPGQPHTRAPSYHVQHVVSPTQAPTYWAYGPQYVAMAPPRSSAVPEGLIPIANPNEAQHGGPVSLPGFNQLHIEANVPSQRSASGGPQMSMQQQQHHHLQRQVQGHPQAYQLAPQQRLQPMQTRHLPFPQSAGMQHYPPPNGMQPVHYYSHPPGTTLVGWDANGNPEYSFAGPANGMPVYVQQGMPVQEFISYPPHAFQNGVPPQQPAQEGGEPRQEGGPNPIILQPHATHHNVFAYQYAPGEDMEMDAPTPSVNGAHHDEAEQIQEEERLDEPMSEPESEASAVPVDSAEEEWIPKSFKKTKKTTAAKGGAKKKKGKGGKGSPKTTPTKKSSAASKKVTGSPVVHTPLDKANKVIIKLPPLMPVDSNLVRYTSLAEEKQTDTVKRECFTCGCRDPPSWRKSTLSPSRILCNRCGIYERSHKKVRPIGEVEMRAVTVAATAAKKVKGKGGPKKSAAGSLNAATGTQLRSSYAAHPMTPAGYANGHAMYSSYGQENEARRVSAVSGLPPGITDPAGYSTKATKTSKKARVSGRSVISSREKSGGSSFKTFTNCAPYSGVPRMEPYQHALVAHRSELTSSVPLEKAHGSGRPTAIHRSASAMPAAVPSNMAPWGNPYGDDDDEDEQ